MTDDRKSEFQRAMWGEVSDTEAESRRAERAEAYVERLQEENRSLVQTIRRVLRAEPVVER